MKNYDAAQHKFVEPPAEVIAFFDEIEVVCRKHGFSISHEDNSGGFEVKKFSEELMEWLREATLDFGR